VTFDVLIDGRRTFISISSIAEDPGAGPGTRLRVEIATSPRLDDSAAPLVQDIDVRRTPEGLSLMNADGRSVDVVMVRADAGAWAVHLPRVSVLATVGERRAGAPTTVQRGDGDAHVTAPLPGRVVRVLVEAGAEVAVRQELVVIEAMKMENALLAPRAGRVRDIRVSDGTTVEAGRVLLIIGD
jgi:biotin carboxyl carrier protein